MLSSVTNLFTPPCFRSTDPKEKDFNTLLSYSQLILLTGKDQLGKLIDEGKSFYRRRIRPTFKHKSRVEERFKSTVTVFESALLARQLNIPHEVLKGLPRLKTFLECNYVVKHAERCGEIIRYNEGEKRVEFLLKKEWITWDALEDLINTRKILINEYYKMINAKFTADGLWIQEENLVEVTPDMDEESIKNGIENNFIVARRVDPAIMNGRWIFNLITEYDPNGPRWRGDHPYREIWTPYGQVINFGFYPDGVANSFMRKVGVNHFVDDGLSSTFGGKIIKTAEVVGKENAILRLNKILKDSTTYIKMKRGDDVPETRGDTSDLGALSPPIFCTSTHNCTTQVLRDFEALDIKHDPEEFKILTDEFFIPRKVYNILSYIPLVNWVARRCFNMLMRLAIYFYVGDADLVSKDVKKLFPDVEGLYPGFFNHFFGQLYAYCPYKLARLQEKINKKCTEDILGIPLITNMTFN